MEDLPVGSEITLKVVEINKKSCSNCQYKNSRELCGEEYCGQKYWSPKLEE